MPPPLIRAGSRNTGDRALLYCTFNGAANCTNGIGRQTQTLLGALTRRWDDLTAITGPFTPYLAIPEPGPATWAYDPQRLADTQHILHSRGGCVVPLVYEQSAPFWSPAVWRQLSQQAARAARALATCHDDVAVIAVDTPFAGTATAHVTGRSRPTEHGRIRVLLALYGTAYLHSPSEPSPDRLVWEQHALTAAAHPQVHIADIGNALTEHLTTTYNVPHEALLPYKSALDLTDPDLRPMPHAEAVKVAADFAVPLDRSIVLAVGRTDPIKGFDQLIAALTPLRDRVHLVAVIVPFDGHDPLTTAYQQQITDAGLRATYVPRFTRTLPRALASLPTTAAVACPSRGEALANLPFEVGLWARHGGPVIVAPDLGGFPETVSHDDNGILYHPASADGLTDALRQAVTLDTPTRTAMCRRAYQRVAAERDVVSAYGDTLTRLFATPTPAR